MNKNSSSSQRAVSEKYEQSSGMGVCKNISSKKTRKEKDEWEEFVHFIEELDLGSRKAESEGDFEGIFTRDPDSKFRKMIQRVKSTQSDPIMKGKIMARTSGRWTKSCADTGCLLNIMAAKPAQAGGLKSH